MSLSLFSNPSTNIPDADLMVRKLLQTLLDEPNVEPLNYTEMARVCSALFVRRDPILLRVFREGLREVLKKLSTQMDNPTAALVLAYTLCLLPHAEIKPDESYEIPEWDETQQKWLSVCYQVQPIELTPTWGPEAFVMTDRERVFAYGLKPMQVHESDSKGSVSTLFTPRPILLFKGKPFPLGQGFATQWFADWYSTPGSWLLHTGRGRLQRWFSQNPTPARVFGFGQGGSQACQILFEEALQNKISEVTAYNPSNLRAFKSEEHQKQWSRISSKAPKVHIIDQQNSNSHLNELLPDWKITKIKSSSSHWQLWNHILCYASHANVPQKDLTEESMLQTIHERWQFNLAINHVGRNLVFALFALPCRFLVIPLVRAILQHKTEALILSLMIFAFMMFPGVVTGPLGITAAIAATLYLGYQLFKPIIERFAGFKPVSEAFCHLPEPDEMTDRRHLIYS